MKLLLILFSLMGTSLALAVQNNTQSRLVGSANVESKNDFPWMVSIQYNGIHVCGGAAIDKRWILTSAKCVSSLNNKLTQIRYNTLIVNFGGKQADISSFVPHPDFDSLHYTNNIALIHTAADLDITRFAQIPCAMNTQLNALLQFAGWGSRKSDSNEANVDLQYIQIPFLELKCAPYHIDIGINMDDSMFCAGDYEHGGIGLCNGDEGGVANRPATSYAYGIGSFHLGCAQPRLTSVFTKVSNYKGWIQATTGIPCVAPNE